jgi:hypothetical protein
MKSLKKLNLNSTHLSALTFEGLKVGLEMQYAKLAVYNLIDCALMTNLHFK